MTKNPPRVAANRVWPGFGLVNTFAIPPLVLFAKLIIPTMIFLAMPRSGSAEPEPQSPAAVEFFETKIRPVLVQHCYECHAADSADLGGSLQLDWAGGMNDGGDTGPALVAGDSGASLLISALKYESSEMPPSGRLSDQVVRDFERWIDDGAVDPRITAAVGNRSAAGGLIAGGGVAAVGKPFGESSIDIAAGREFWAFQPPRHTPGPEPQPVTAIDGSSQRGAGMIDAFLNRSINAAAIRVLPIASPETRLRRLCFDLTGLPPSAARLRGFIDDPSDSHYRRLVDNLLASPGYAEHWARHWMDVARYADSNGSDFNATFHDAWRYRDYLVRSIAADVPVDQMIRQQIAGDLLPAESDSQRHDNLVATTFLMIGTKMLSERNKPKLTMDVVDEQIDTIGRAFMGLTLGCARCHDHKFDPIPTRDYYALAGIFRSTRGLQGESQEYVSTWKPTVLPVSQSHADRIRDHESKLKSIASQIKQLETERANLNSGFGGIVVDDDTAIKTGHWVKSTSSNQYVGAGYLHDGNTDKGDTSIKFQMRVELAGQYEVRLHFPAGGNRAGAVPVEVDWAGLIHQRSIDQQIQPGPDAPCSLGIFAGVAGQVVSVTIRNRGTTGYVIADAVEWLPLSDQQHAVADKQGNDPAATKIDPAATKIDPAATPIADRIKSLRAELKELESAAPPPLPHAMAVADLPIDQQSDCPLHIRGEVDNLGDPVPRGFLRVCEPASHRDRRRNDGDPDASLSSVSAGSLSSGSTAAKFNGSGRIELAAWMTGPDHPLTSRVSVNRIWTHLMGSGIVRTVDNFGQRGEHPSHPELLDALAVEFVRNGWRQKQLVREIVCSDAYARSSGDVDLDSLLAASANDAAGSDAAGSDADIVDPENRLWWKMPRRRITAESIRDSMVLAAGQLDRGGRDDLMAGYAVLVSKNTADSTAARTVEISDAKRSLYAPVIRSEVPPLLACLDAADPDLLVGQRPMTNVPAQALVLIGSPDVQNWADQAAVRMLDETDDFDARVEWCCRHLFSRPAGAGDFELARRFFGDDRSTEISQGAWHAWIAAMMASTEFRFLD